MKTFANPIVVGVMVAATLVILTAGNRGDETVAANEPPKVAQGPSMADVPVRAEDPLVARPLSVSSVSDQEACLTEAWPHVPTACLVSASAERQVRVVR